MTTTMTTRLAPEGVDEEPDEAGDAVCSEGLGVVLVLAEARR